jgi:hypothetical protein
VCRRNPKETFQINERQNRLRDLKSKCKSIWRAIWQCLPKMEARDRGLPSLVLLSCGRESQAAKHGRWTEGGGQGQMGRVSC